MSAPNCPADEPHFGFRWMRTSRRWVFPLVASCAVAWATLFLLPKALSNGQAMLEVNDAPSLRAATLTVRGTHAQRAYGYVTAVGEVSNVSRRELKHIEVVVELLDARRHILGVESALLELPTLSPGDSSPFSVQAHDVPGLTAYRVRFRTLLGSAIPARRESM